MTLLNYSNISDSLILFSSDDEDSEANCETKQYNNFSAMLKGVPPPSSITISKFTVEEMLQRYKNYENSSGFFFQSENCDYLPNKRKCVPFLKYSNSSHMSENIASLIQKVQERYVQLETMSSCNIWFNATLQSCGSAKKRQRMKQGIGLSPGRRLSHLARRRQFFSSANLQRLANADVRQIEIKKSDSQRCERRKMNRTVEYEKLNSSKRALFLSPENGTPTKYGNTTSGGGRVFSSGSDERQKLPLKEKSKKVEVLKWLSEQNFDVDFPRKRLRGDSGDRTPDRQRKCPRRSLNFADEEVPKSSNSAATSESSNSTKKRVSTSLGQLSQNHKNKLLWAVSVVLKENNILRNDLNFKTCASTLFHKCRRNFDEILNIKSANGTSEKILQYARKEIPAIFSELGIQSQISNEEKTARKTEEIRSLDNKNEMKENVIRNNSEDSDHSKSKCSGGDLDFVFKTPNKICRKRPVKSCQKNENSFKKVTCMRKWHSLESLKHEDDKQKFSSKTFDKLIEGVSVLDNSYEVNYLSKINAGAYSLKEGSLGQENVENKCLNVDEPTQVFSPIPSSLKDECETPKALFPALNFSPGKSEVNSDTNSCTSEADDSAEIVNQDKEIQLGIENLLLKENLISQASENIESTHKVSDISMDVPGIAQNKEKFLSDIECNSQINRTQEKDGCVESGLLFTEETEHKEENHIFNFVGDPTEESYSNTGVDEVPSTLDSGNVVFEIAAYKPRKLIVKKSKPNWKVVRKNSEECENESDLRLKMRLSHEWEIVCRNSSCSDIGNASEWEASSLNCSQVSSTNDEKVLSSEMDLDESNIQSSAQSGDESMDHEWEKPNNSLKRNGKCELNSVCSNSPHLNEDKVKESMTKNCSVYENNTEMLICPDIQRQVFKSHQDEHGCSDYEESCNNFFRSSIVNRTANSNVTEGNLFNTREPQTNFSDKDAMSGNFDSSLRYENIYGNVLSVSYGQNHSREEDSSFTEGYSHTLYNSEDSSLLFVQNHTPSEHDSGKALNNRHIGSPKNVEENFNGDENWNRGLIHSVLKMENPLFNYSNGRRDCCL